MKKTHALLILSLTALLSSCSISFDFGKKSSDDSQNSTSASGAEGEDGYSVYTGEIKVATSYNKAKAYLGELNSSQPLPCVTFTFVEDVPYVTLEDYYLYFFGPVFGEFFSVNGNEVTNRNTGVSLYFDVESNSIYTSDYDQFSNFTGTILPVDIFSAAGDTADPLSLLDEDASTYQKGEKMTYKLGAYHAQLVRYDGSIYVPFSFLDTITCSSLSYRFVWNGNDFYLHDGGYLYDHSALTQYGSSFYSGALNSAARSQSYADYNYYSFLFQMRNFYGRYYTLGVSDLDKEFERLGLKSKLTSRLPATADAAIAEALIKVFADGGHTYFKNRGFGCKYSASTDYELQGKIIEDSRYIKGYQAYNALSSYRKQNNITSEGLYTKNSTALIVFDSFAMNAKGASPTAKNVEGDSVSTFGIIYNALKKISYDSSIKNVVFDVSMNGGGLAPALGHALSFLTDDPICLNTKNPHTGSISKEVIYVDNDFDGDAKSPDSYAGKYNFYILTSPYSFSCGNAFPCLAKDNGWAKIVGQRSGGGDCAVANGISSDGTSWSMSGNTSLLHNDLTSLDDGAEVDYALDYSSYYDLAKLDSFLSSKQ